MKVQKLIPLLVIGFGLLVFANSLRVGFLFDDVGNIVENVRIRQFWTPWEVLAHTPRPLVMLSLALNYAFAGLNPWGYHLFNVVIHILAALTLYGVVRLTFLSEALRSGYGEAATWLAGVVSLLWLVHPLQTESVTYVIQRCESLMGLFYLLTLYCAIRAANSPSPIIWYVASVASCLSGMACKEVMVTAPLIVLLYDRTFLSGSFAKAWCQRWRLYVGLAATWIPLAYLIVTNGNYGGTAGFGTNIPWQAYALTQLQATALYLKLSVWPHPLVFDYGNSLALNFREVASSAFIVAVLLTGTLVALRRWPAIGFVGAWFFAILVPTSSVVPVVTQTMAEHRMYLPLAAVVVMVTMSVFELGRNLLSSQQQKVFVSGVSGVVIVLLAMLTIRRNQDYRSELGLWQDTAAKCPNNSRARYNVGVALDRAGKLQEAIDCYEQALRITPEYADAHYNLGEVLARLNRVDEAMAHWERALQINPDFAEAHYNIGVALVQLGKADGAIGHWEQALRIKPDYAEAHYNLGVALERIGKTQEAIKHHEQALRINPDYTAARNELARLRLAQ